MSRSGWVGWVSGLCPVGPVGSTLIKPVKPWICGAPNLRAATENQILPSHGAKVITVEAALKGFETAGLSLETAALLDELDAMFWK